MSLGFLPIFNPPLPAVRFPSDGCALLQFSDALDALAARHGLLPLTTFADTREIPEDFDGDPADLEDMLGPRDDWFAPAAVLPSIDGLMEILRRDSTTIGDTAEREWVYAELESLYEVLRTAATAGSQFRLELVS